VIQNQFRRKNLHTESRKPISNFLRYWTDSHLNSKRKVFDDFSFNKETLLWPKTVILERAPVFKQNVIHCFLALSGVRSAVQV
jgi:hypothetical protein